MTGPDDGLAGRTTRLRIAFDRSFAEPAVGIAPRREHLLTIRVGGQPYAVRLSEVAGVFTGWSVVPVPGPRPELLGVAGHRGDLIPVYSLAALLRPPEPTEPPEPADSVRPGGVLLAAGTKPVAFAFDRTDGHVRMPADALPPAERGSTAWAVVQAAGVTWTIVVLARLVAAIEPETGERSAPDPSTGSEQP